MPLYHKTARIGLSIRLSTHQCCEQCVTNSLPYRCYSDGRHNLALVKEVSMSGYTRTRLRLLWALIALAASIAGTARPLALRGAGADQYTNYLPIIRTFSITNGLA